MSRNMVVCCAAQEYGMCTNYVSLLTETIKSQFSRIHISMIFYLIDTKVAVDVHAYQGRLHAKFEENYTNHFQDMSEQTSVCFFHLFAHLKKYKVNYNTL